MKIYYFFVLFAVAAASYEELACDEETKSGISWPSTKGNTCSTSSPLCIDAHNEIKRRCCSADLRWDLEPTCKTIQDTFGPCPKGAVSKHHFCMFIIRNTTYPFHCPFEEVLPFAEYLNFVESDLFPIWMPVERKKDKYGDGLHLYTEPSANYGLTPSKYVFQKPFSDKRCMVYHKSTKYEAVPCSTPHTGICAYIALHRTTNRYCSRMFQTCISSDYPAGSKCFCPTENSGDQQEEMAEFFMPYQSLLIGSLQKNCLIGLEKVVDDYFWINSKTKLNYTFWAGDAVFGDSRKYGVFTEKGWILVRSKNETNCVINQKQVILENWNLTLTYNNTKKIFFLDLSNANAVVASSDGTPLVFCFTDAARNELVRRLDLLSSYTFFPINDGPGNYWCEAFVYPNVKLIKSNVVFPGDTMEEYIAIMETNYNDRYLLDLEQLKNIQASLHKETAAISSISNFTPRIYKVVSIDEKNSKATLNFHFSIKSDRPLQNYSNLRRELSELRDFRLIQFLSADICIDISENGVTWLNADIGEVAEKPKEAWCTKSDGSIVNRRCEGDFINGAEWSTLAEPCNLQESTNITINLTNIINQQKPMKYIHQVVELISEQADIRELEIDLISEFLEQLVDLDNADFNLTIHIINELMNLPESTLRRSQELYNSTDKILASLDKLLERSGFIGEVNLSNLKVFSDSILNVFAMDFYEESYVKHFGSRLPNTGLDNFHCRLMFHEIIRNRLSNSTIRDSQLSIVFFKSSTLFHKLPGIQTKKIIRLIMPAFKNDNEVTIQAAFENGEDGAFSCSNWHYEIGRTKGYWSHNAILTDKSSNLLCKFDVLQHHAFIQVNLTEVLENIIVRSNNIEEKLHDITSIVRSFRSNFVPREVLTIVQFLSSQIQYIVNEQSLDAVANLIDEIIDIPTQLLDRSEKEHSTTTTVLRCLENISQHFDSILEIHKSNFYLYIGGPESTKGFGIKLRNSSYIIELFDTVPTIYEEYELYGWITRKSSMISKNKKLAFMVYFKNSLFTMSKYSTKAVGLLSSDDTDVLEISYALDQITTTNHTCQRLEGKGGLFYEKSMAEEFNKYYKCSLSGLSYVWLVYDYINVTSTFDDIINNSATNEHDLRKVLEILERMLGILSAMDIFLVSKLFSKLSYVDEVILKICVGIVNMLTYVNTNILDESQSRFKATGNMLAEFNRISSLLNESMEVQHTNTYLSVVLLEGKDVSDIEKRSFHHSFYMDYNFTIDIGAILHQLKNTNISKVIFTVYYNNAFFIPHVDTGYIFNVILPDCEKVLSEGIVLSVSPSIDQIDYHCGYWNQSWVYGGEIMSSSCTFFRQGFISMIARADPNINVTKYLNDLFDKSGPEKLYSLQSIVSKFPDNFTAKDLELVAQIFDSITEEIDDLRSTVYIINNLMKIPKDVLQEAGEQGALNTILMMINKIVTHAKPQTIFNANFGVAKCSLCTATRITLTKGNVLSCSDTEDLKNVIATLYIDQDMVEQKMVCKAAITVFMNSDLFVGPKQTYTSIILGISFYKKLDTNNEIRLAFNKEIFDQDSCSYWIIPRAKGKSGTWSSIAPAQISATTRNCSFNTYSYYTLTRTRLSTILDNILNYYSEAKDRLFHTKEALQSYKGEINDHNVYKVAVILRSIETLTEDYIAELAEIISIIAESYKNQSILNSTENDGAWKVLGHVDRLLSTFTGNIHLGTQEVSFLVTESKADFVLTCEEKCSILQVQSATVAEESVMNEECDAALSPLAIHDLLPNKLKIQLFRDAALFQGGEDLTEGVIVKVDDGTGQSASTFRMYYKDHNTGAKQFCGYWEHVHEGGSGSGKWAVDSLPTSQSEMKICSVKQSNYFSLVKVVQNTTDDLVNIKNSTDTFTEKLQKVAKITTEKAQVLEPVDISIISNILGLFEHAEQITITEMNHTSTIVNNMMSVPRQVLKQSQQSFSATDNVLYNLDQISMKTNSYTLVAQTHFYSISIDLDKDICGFTIKIDSDNYKVDYIVRGKSIEVVTASSFLTGVLLSEEVLEQLRNSNKTQQKRMIANIFFKDSLFNERSKLNADVSIVNGVLIPDLNGPLKGNVNVFYNASRLNQSKSCNFWKYLETPEQQGSWKVDASPKVINSTVVCTYDHITHFAMLISNDDDNFDDPYTDYILTFITDVNCLLSSLGLIGIVVTAIVFERWRKNTGNQILLHFSFAISIKIALLYASSGIYHLEGTKSVWCNISGGILHYAVLSESCWMLIIAILQFKRFVEVLGGPPKYVLWKACICGWLFPALPVIILAATNKDSYSKGHLQLCYPSDLGLYLAVWLPLIIIITINCVIFVFIIYNVCHKKTETREPVNYETLFQWRLALLLFSMLGLTWLFGFISLIEGATFFTYLFCFSATLQGFVMFLFFIVFNKSTKLLYIQAIKMWLYSKGYK